jgi:phage gp29-like protein
MGKILDQYGRELSSTKKPDTKEIATFSLQDRYSTYPSEGLTPYKLARIFKQADNGDIMRQSELFEEMESKDLHLFDCLQVRRKAVLGANATWEVIATSDSKEDKKIAEFIESQFDNIPDLEDYFEDLLEAVGKGFRIQEIRWDISEGQAIIERLKSIPNKRFTFFDSNLPKIITDKAPNGEELPAYKFIYHKPSVKCGSQLKGGILRIAAWMYLFKNYSIKDWVSFAEIYGMPLRLGKYDTGASKGDKRALIQALRSLGSDAAGIISKNTEVEFVEAMKNAKGDIYETLSNFCNREISKGILGQTLSIDTAGSTGTYSAAKAHELVRQDLREADAKSLAATIQSQLIVPLVGFNFGWDIAKKSCPKFKINVYKSEDLYKTAETYDKLVNMGLEISQDHVYKKFGVAKPKEGEKTLKPPKYQQVNQIENKATTQVFPFKKENKEFTPEQEEIEGLVDTAVNQAQGVYDEYIKTIKEVIVNAQSYEEIQEKLFDLYDDLDSGDLEELTARVFFVADLYGRGRVLDGD